MTQVATPGDRPWSAVSLLPEALQPFSRRIPLLVAVLLSGVVGSMVWFAHDRVYSAVVSAELTRLQASSNQLATALEGSANRFRQEGARMSGSPAIARVVGSTATATERRLVQRLLMEERRRSPQMSAIAVFDSAHRLILVDGNREVAARAQSRDAPGSSVLQSRERDVGPLFAAADTVLYATESPVSSLFGSTVGSLVIVRRLGTARESGSLFGGLVGRRGRVLLGNASGGFWTDLTKPVPGPPTPLMAGAGVGYRDQLGVEQLASPAAVRGTPWLVLVEVRRRDAVAGASTFVVQMLIIAAVLILGAAVVSWFLIRRSIRPLYDVTVAAADLAKGEYSRRVHVRSSDELGQLGESFNAMAEKVENATTELESRANALVLANQDLHESEQRYRGLFEHLPDGILVHRDKRVVFANPASLRLLGVSGADELVGRSVLEFVSADDGPIASTRLDTIMHQEVAGAPVELKLVRPDEKQVVIEATSMPLMVDGVRAVQTIMHDVTDRRLLEEQLRQSQKMDAVGRLAGGIAHDFNNLLTVISAHAEFALSAEESDEARRHDIEAIKQAAESAARLTRQLLTFSRKQVLTPNHIDLNAAITGTLGLLKRLIGDDIEVVTVARKGLSGIWADPGQVEQVLLNLAVNARDAMPEGGVLRFETANVTIGEGYDGVSGSVIPPGDYVMLAVQDTGVGMSDDVRTRIFEPFYTTKPPGQGTGLGLSTVYGIVRQSHGHIWVYSELQRGTTFKIYFPPHREQRPSGVLTTAAEHRIPHTVVRALVVEDEPSVRAAVCRALTTAGFLVTEAMNAASAIDILSRDDTIDVMITDMVMPGKSGPDLVADVAITHPNLPVVIMSGYSEESANKEWTVPPNATFVEKPVSPHELLSRIRALLARTSN